jgi:predicted  nucleic acid-binding Zn-ribbon protein
VNPELQALLVVQGDDTVIRGIEERMAAIAPRLAAMDAAHKGAAANLARSEAALDKELARQRDLDGRIADHRLRHEKNVEILNNAQKLKEATAAAAQVEAARRALADEESELLAITRRITDLRTAVAAHRDAVATIAADQASARETLSAERAALERELTAARAKRSESARHVGASLLAKYDRVHTRRRTEVVVALHDDFSCGACETAIPLQRRPAMSSGNVVEPCEGCGVLLYYRPAAPA